MSLSFPNWSGVNNEKRQMGLKSLPALPFVSYLALYRYILSFFLTGGAIQVNKLVRCLLQGERVRASPNMERGS